MVKAYYDALDWFGKNKDEGNKLVGTAIKEKPEDVAADLTTIQLMDLAQSKQFMGTSTHPGKIYDRTTEAAQFWKDNGTVQRVVSPDKAVDPGFLSAA
jgi:ABC-type nitrate/sulfonate/bicarbonate transport system substrate-binding protein